MDIETTKIANVFESPVAGVLRKKVVAEGETVPVGALLGVVSEPGVPDAEVEKFVGEFLENFKPPEKGAGGGPQPEFVEAGGKRIRYLKAGPDEGTPIVLIHGFGADLHGLDVQPGGARRRPPGLRDRPSRPRRLVEGRRRRLDARPRRGRDRLHGRAGHRSGASRRPFARRRGRDR